MVGIDVEALLEAENRHEILTRLTSGECLLAFDFDGTLAPIVADRDAARLRPATEELLLRVAERYRCAVVSGRGRDDVAGRLGAARIEHVVGNHGVEPSPEMEACEREVGTIAPLLEELATMRGVQIENKRFSLAIHFRAAPDREASARAIRAAIRALKRPLRVVDGDCVVNAVPEGAPNKGDAVLRLMAVTAARAALFVGDDVTDEDVFALDDPRVIGVRVGRSNASRARWFLRHQGQIDDLLEALLATSRVAAAEKPKAPR